MSALLQVRNITVEFPASRAAAHTAVDNVSFDVDAAEVVGLMGESGCGKTTLSLAMLGLLAKEQAAVSGSWSSTFVALGIMTLMSGCLEYGCYILLDDRSGMNDE